MFIHTELLLEKHNDLSSDIEMIEVPFMFNTENIVTARPVVDDDETPLRYRRRTVITLTDGNMYMIKHDYKEVVNWVDPSGSDGNFLNTYPTKPTLDIAN